MSADVSILPTLVGGALTIAGGLVVYKLTEDNRKKHFLLEKIEQIYRDSANLKTALTIEANKSREAFGPGYKLSVNDIQNPIALICMQLKIYFPYAKDVRGSLEKQGENFLAAIWKAMDNKNRNDHETSITIQRHLAYTINALTAVQDFLEKETRLRT